MNRVLKNKELQDALNLSSETINVLVEKGLSYDKQGEKIKLFSQEETKNFISHMRENIRKLMPGEVITTEELLDSFKCNKQGGMKRAHATNTLVLISDYSHCSSIYENKWFENGEVLHYTGMGLYGNQDINARQNKTLNNSNSNGVEVHLFEVFKSQQYTYRGIVKLVREPYQEIEKDKNNEERKVWRFPLKLLKNRELLSSNIIEENERSKLNSIKSLSTYELKEKIKSGGTNVSARIVKNKRYERNLYISEYAKRRANGICELCNEKAPFKNELGEPYLEGHHITWLSRNGGNSIDNVVALCPNCHKKMHIVDNEEDVKLLKNLAK